MKAFLKTQDNPRLVRYALSSPPPPTLVSFLDTTLKLCTYRRPTLCTLLYRIFHKNVSTLKTLISNNSGG